jgi:dTDP-4-dehydrorhamnose reductase
MPPLHYVVLGANGQLGSDLCPRLPGRVTPLTRGQLDLTHATAAREVLRDLKPDVVVNCAAYNFVDRAEGEPELAFAVNAHGVHRLAMACEDLGATLVYFSSDYVFGLDAERRTPYGESDAPGPLSVYGSSKLAGENAVRGLCRKHYIFRTCGLYGASGSGGKGTNFVETMLRLAAQGKAIRVVNDQMCTPSATVDVAGAAVQLLQEAPAGLYHVTNGGATTWYDFARAIFELAGVRANLTPTTSAEYGAAAQRPAYSVLRSEHAGTPVLRPWREALAAYLAARRGGSD